MSNLEKEYESAFEFLMSTILNGYPELDRASMIELYKTCESSFTEVVSYLDGWTSAKGYGLDNNTRSWLNSKLEGE